MADEKAVPWTLDRIVRMGISGIFFAAFIWLAGFLSDVLIPFMFALLGAYLLNPFVVAVQKKTDSRPVAVMVTLFAVVCCGVFLFWVTAPLLVDEVRHMGSLLRALVADSELSRRAARVLPEDIWLALRGLAAQQQVQEFFSSGDMFSLGQKAIGKVVPGVWGVLKGAASLVSTLVGLFVIVLYLIFLLMDFEVVQRQWTGLLIPAHRETVRIFLTDFADAMSRYFRAQVLVAGLVGLLFAVGFGLIGLPLGIVLGLFIGLLNMVPYLQLLGVLPAVLLGIIHSLETGMDIGVCLGLVALVFVVVQIIQDGVLVPRIMGRVTGLSPAVILLSLSIWGKLLGMLGLLIAIPATCLLWAWYQRYVTHE